MFTDNRGTSLIQNGVCAKAPYTAWMGLSTLDIQSSLDYGAGSAQVAGTTTVGGLQNAKLYMYDHHTTHVWKNNSNTVAIIEFYKMTPRRDLPVFTATQATGNGADPQQIISPPGTYNYVDCVRGDPNMYVADFANMGAASFWSSSTKIAYNDVDATPFMSQTMSSLFKIRRLKVKGPSGSGAVQTLQPGQEATLFVKNQRPRLVNYAKYGLGTAGASGSVTQNRYLANTYEVLKETPLIFMYIRGGVGHEKTVVTNVAPTKAWVDYIVKKHWNVFNVNSGSRSTQSLVVQPTMANPAEEVNAFGGGQIVEEADV